ncbi:hypothetical protein [Shewanella surugensis]|uniref:Uncharacterized protein n=1 Tax=Shewanella surugensis TaxID=212020 RepID=A0ABT0LJF6_9GAMM|nr:hypothetical protein [Shewanella surugensis]MCL1127590.1 hypothetical protein [Shewanella surugensis]
MPTTTITPSTFNFDNLTSLKRNIPDENEVRGKNTRTTGSTTLYSKLGVKDSGITSDKRTSTSWGSTNFLDRQAKYDKGRTEFKAALLHLCESSRFSGKESHITSLFNDIADRTRGDGHTGVLKGSDITEAYNRLTQPSPSKLKVPKQQSLLQMSHSQHSPVKLTTHSTLSQLNPSPIQTTTIVKEASSKESNSTLNQVTQQMLQANIKWAQGDGDEGFSSTLYEHVGDSKSIKALDLQYPTKMPKAFKCEQAVVYALMQYAKQTGNDDIFSATKENALSNKSTMVDEYEYDQEFNFNLLGIGFDNKEIFTDKSELPELKAGDVLSFGYMSHVVMVVEPNNESKGQSLVMDCWVSEGVSKCRVRTLDEIQSEIDNSDLLVLTGFQSDASYLLNNESARKELGLSFSDVENLTGIITSNGVGSETDETSFVETPMTKKLAQQVREEYSFLRHSRVLTE